MSLRPGVTVVIPTIPPRAELLSRAVASALNQTRPPEAFSIEVDRHHQGAGPTRNKAIERVNTEWIAFLDDDDWMYSNHLETLLDVQAESGASICWSWWEGNPVWEHECLEGNAPTCPDLCHRHKDFDFEAPHLFGITYLVRTELAKQCEFPGPDTKSGFYGNEDYLFILQLKDITRPEDWAHRPDRTWFYNAHGANTSGRGDRW